MGLDDVGWPVGGMEGELVELGFQGGFQQRKTSQILEDLEYNARLKSIKRNEQNKVAKKNLEVAILKALEASGDNILDDEPTVEIL